MKTKKLLAVLMAALMVAATSAVAFAKPGTNGLIGMPNPFVACETLEEAKAVAGFDMAVPEKAAGCKQVWINAVKGDMIQVCYQSKSNQVILRKAKGWQENLDGDYNVYSNTEYKLIAYKLVKERGEDRIFAATWFSKGYTFSMTADRGVTQKSLNKIVKAVR